ncbi:hypothetical protein RHCRD62_60265 [Rhodococcus sp. RD6.2]|nr:hypothetical protein RHCRD62_60265 [Rhodococcus sp. RD6.2]
MRIGRPIRRTRLGNAFLKSHSRDIGWASGLIPLMRQQRSKTANSTTNQQLSWSTSVYAQRTSLFNEARKAVSGDDHSPRH